jgi:hypothetical protein
MLHDMLLVHSRTSGRMQTKHASEDQRPGVGFLSFGRWVHVVEGL